MKAIGRLTLGMVALILVAAGPLAAQQAKIVYIDSERIRQEAPSLQAARQRLQTEMGQLQAQADSALSPLQQELQSMAQEFQQQQSMMTQDKRQERQQALAAKQQELQQKGAQYEQQAQAKQNEILGPALQRINAVIDTIRQEQGYTFILDIASGGVVAADPSLDITNEVLRRLNAVANKDQ